MVRRANAVVVILLISGATAWSAWRFGCDSVHRVQLAAFAGAFLSLFWSVVAAVAGALTSGRSRPAARPAQGGRPRPPNTFHVAALLFAVIPVVIEAVILAMRVVYVGIDLVFGAPEFVAREYGYSSDGLWSLLTLLLSCFVAMVSTRDRRLVTCALLLSVSAVVWYCLLGDVFRKSQINGWERTGATVWIAVGVSALLLVTTAVTFRVDQRRRWRAVLTSPDELAADRQGWPGLRPAGASLVVVLMVLTAYHIVVPVAIEPGGARAAALIAALGAVAGSSAGFALLARSWSRHLADATMGLMSLGLTGLAVSLVPTHEAGLAEHYPGVFSASIVGLAFACALWTWLSGVWHQQLDHDLAWTTAGRLIPHARRAAALAAALAILVSALLAVWPRLRGIRATDDSLVAVASGLWAHLFLLLVVLWAARKHRRVSLYVLGILTVVSMIMFIVMRLLPFSPQFG